VSNRPPVTIFLDLDGVAVGFVESSLRLFGRDFADIAWPPGQYDIAEALGMNRNHFWETVNAAGVDFWRQLEPYTWFDELYRELARRGKVCFATSPTHSPNSAAGKMAWLKDRFGSDFKEFIITRRKHYLSRSMTLLLDDSDKQVREFIRRGSGCAVLFPQIWNSAYPFIEGNRLQYVLTQIDAAISGMNNV